MTATAARMVARPQNLKYGNWPFSKFPAASSPPLSAKMRSKHRTDGDAQSTAAKRRRAFVSAQQAGFQYRKVQYSRYTRHDVDYDTLLQYSSRWEMVRKMPHPRRAGAQEERRGERSGPSFVVMVLKTESWGMRSVQPTRHSFPVPQVQLVFRLDGKGAGAKHATHRSWVSDWSGRSSRCAVNAHLVLRYCNGYHGPPLPHIQYSTQLSLCPVLCCSSSGKSLRKAFRRLGTGWGRSGAKAKHLRL